MSSLMSDVKDLLSKVEFQYTISSSAGMCSSCGKRDKHLDGCKYFEVLDRVSKLSLIQPPESITKHEYTRKELQREYFELIEIANSLTENKAMMRSLGLVRVFDFICKEAFLEQWKSSLELEIVRYQVRYCNLNGKFDFPK